MAKRKAARKKRARKTKISARKATVRKIRKVARPKARKGRLRNATASQARKTARKAVSARKAAARPRKAAASQPRKAARPAARTKVPALNRVRRTVVEDDMVPTPPSSLDLNRTASAVRTGRHALHEKFAQHTETSPAITGGDIDADWESAYSVGDEAPGGDNPTPDQDIVDDIGKALGVQYQDNEELKGEKKISDRDKKRWELDPASSDDFKER